MKGATKKKRGRPRLKAGEDPTPSPIQPSTNGESNDEQLFKCDDCIGQYVMIEMQEHLAATGHTGYEPVEQNAELFSEPQPVTRLLNVKLSEEELAALYKQTGEIAVQLDDQRQAKALAAEKIKALEADQTALAGNLRHPYRRAEVECEWRIDIAQNAKVLIRKDTGEEVETSALSEQDRVDELARALSANHAKLSRVVDGADQQEKADEASA